jgi:LysR family transcriptional regulator, hca operon transcriptional activator
MELRHLRYFVAVAEEGSLTHAAERRLHTAQPSLSRQIRDLELEVGVKLLERGARGVALTAAGRTFLDHARLALLQVEAAGEAARRAAQPEKATFMIGFLTGHEVVWLPHALRILREEAPGIEITLASQSSPELAGALMRGKVDVAFLRRETQAPGVAFKFMIKELLVAMVPTGHRLASRKKISPQEIAAETYITPTRPGIEGGDRRLHGEVRHYAEAGIRGDNLTSTMSLVASTGGVTVLPIYARHVLSSSAVLRPLKGEPPTIDLFMGYNRSNTSPLLKRFRARADEFARRTSSDL